MLHEVPGIEDAPAQTLLTHNRIKTVGASPTLDWVYSPGSGQVLHEVPGIEDAAAQTLLTHNRIKTVGASPLPHWIGFTAQDLGRCCMKCRVLKMLLLKHF
ncbi:hypothetical protein [Pseudomonas sp. MPB23]|uniref:hypothetical protein n=1 Tax=Pseudomonas sp. MPB23 TaxID=3388490 RepID=UPI0039856330